MAYQDMYGHMHDGSPPDYDNTNGQINDPPPPRRLRAHNWRPDPQFSPPGLWTTREGVALRITAMSDQHLGNSIRMLERGARGRARLEAFRADRYASTAPDAAADAATEAAREMYDMADDPKTDIPKLAELVWPKYKELKAEAKRRGLTAP
jgi:hypothetical protein